MSTRAYIRVRVRGGAAGIVSLSLSLSLSTIRITFTTSSLTEEEGGKLVSFSPPEQPQGHVSRCVCVVGLAKYCTAVSIC